MSVRPRALTLVSLASARLSKAANSSFLSLICKRSDIRCSSAMGLRPRVGADGLDTFLIAKDSYARHCINQVVYYTPQMRTFARIGVLVCVAAVSVATPAVGAPSFVVTTPTRTKNSPPRDRIEEELNRRQPVRVNGDASDALMDAGCTVGAGPGAGSAVVEAFIRLPTDDATDVLSTCTYAVLVKAADGSEIYKEKVVTDDLNCSEPWLRSEIRRHVSRACQLAKALEPRVAVVSTSPTPAPPQHEEKGWVAPALASAAGVGVLGMGIFYVQKDGQAAGRCPAADCNREHDTAPRGWAFIATGAVASAVGGWWLLNRLNDAPIAISLSSSTVEITGHF